MHSDEQRTHRQPQVSQLEGKTELLQLQAFAHLRHLHFSCVQVLMEVKETHSMQSYTGKTFSWLYNKVLVKGNKKYF